MAGGDGTQALVAGVAAEHGIPFAVITAGTRNHFALDLGLDRDDPAACLDALRDGVELRVDLGMIGSQVFVNNASFGAYAEVVETPAYRGDKVGTTLQVLPDLLQRHRGARLSAHADGTEITGPQALLVANNPYGSGDIAALGRRVRLDRGQLGVIAVTVDSARQAAGLLAGTHGRGLRVFATTAIEIAADADRIPVGIDGEAVIMPAPVQCTVRPGALRVWVPRNRPGDTRGFVPGSASVIAGCGGHAMHVDHFKPQFGEPLHEPGQGGLVGQFCAEDGRAAAQGDLTVIEFGLQGAARLPRESDLIG